MADTENTSLEGISLISDLPEKALEEISKRCSWRTFATGEQILDRQSDSCDLYFIVAGRARVVIYSFSGREVTFDDREAGDYFGELAALDGEPRSANVVALEETVVAILSQEGFHRTLMNYPQVAVRILKNLAKIVRISTDRIMDLSTLGANNRVHAELLRLLRPMLTMITWLVFRLSRSMATSCKLVRPVRVARVFSDLTRERILQRDRDALLT